MKNGYFIPIPFVEVVLDTFCKSLALYSHRYTGGCVHNGRVVNAAGKSIKNLLEHTQKILMSIITTSFISYFTVFFSKVSPWKIEENKNGKS